jgi:hypothetical protein
LKDAGCQILGIVEVPRPVVYVVEDTIHVMFIEQTKGFTVALRSAGEDFIFIEFVFLHATILPAGLTQITPADLRSCS